MSSVAVSAKRSKPTPAASCFELRYFSLMAKGLGPALVAQHSGLPWSGNATLGFTIAEHWKALKPQTPFGQLPLLTVLGPDGFELAQTTAIVNCIDQLAQTNPTTNRDGVKGFARSQQLIAEAEDIYNLMVKFLPTLYKRLSDEAVVTSKGTAADYATFWSELLPKQLAHLERLTPLGEQGSSLYSSGELYLFAMLHQAHLVCDTIFAATPTLGEWYARLRADHRTQRVLNGESPMGELAQYFVAVDSPQVCSLGDERGRWG